MADQSAVRALNFLHFVERDSNWGDKRDATGDEGFLDGLSEGAEGTIGRNVDLERRSASGKSDAQFHDAKSFNIARLQKLCVGMRPILDGDDDTKSERGGLEDTRKPRIAGSLCAGMRRKLNREWGR